MVVRSLTVCPTVVRPLPVALADFDLGASDWATQLSFSWTAILFFSAAQEITANG